LKNGDKKAKEEDLEKTKKSKTATKDSRSGDTWENNF